MFYFFFSERNATILGVCYLALISMYMCHTHKLRSNQNANVSVSNCS